MEGKLTLIKKKLQARKCKSPTDKTPVGSSGWKVKAESPENAAVERQHDARSYADHVVQHLQATPSSTAPCRTNSIDSSSREVHDDSATNSDSELLLDSIDCEVKCAEGEVVLTEAVLTRVNEDLQIHAHVLGQVSTAGVVPGMQSVGTRALSGWRLHNMLDYIMVDALPCFRVVCAGFYIALKKRLASDTTLGKQLEKHILSKIKNAVWVAVRVKPGPCESLNISGNTITCSAEVFNPEAGPGGRTNFNFDNVFDGATTQHGVWESMAEQVKRCVKMRFNACLMAYGQTGSGKTHTMFGDPTCREGEGVAFRTLRSTTDILRCRVAADEDLRSRMSIEFSFLEVYNENIYDLLDSKCSHIPIKVSGLHGLTRFSCGVDQMDEKVHKWIREGAATRTVGKTVFNPHSSRSHAVATIYINWSVSCSSCIYLVDLAGSERAGMYSLCDKQLREGCNINQGLSALGRVVATMARGKGEHVAYRDSVLTWLLKDVIIGNGGKAFMLANVNPTSPAETLSTVRYAQQYSALKSGASTALSALGTEVRLLQVQVDMRRFELEGFCSNWRRKQLVDELQEMQVQLTNKRTELQQAQKNLGMRKNERMEQLSQPKIRSGTERRCSPMRWR